MTFEELEDRYHELEERRASGQLSDEEFQAEVTQLSLQDDQGRSWIIGPESGKWYVLRGGRWVQAEPLEDEPAPAAENVCPRCGSSVEEGAVSCANCGYRLTSEAPASARLGVNPPPNTPDSTGGVSRVLLIGGVVLLLILCIGAAGFGTYRYLSAEGKAPFAILLGGPKPTRTSTPTSAPVLKEGPTATAMPSPTDTSTPRPTDTPTPMATDTPTPEPTATDTPTPRPTETHTPAPELPRGELTTSITALEDVYRVGDHPTIQGEVMVEGQPAPGASVCLRMTDYRGDRLLDDCMRADGDFTYPLTYGEEIPTGYAGELVISATASYLGVETQATTTFIYGQTGPLDFAEPDGLDELERVKDHYRVTIYVHIEGGAPPFTVYQDVTKMGTTYNRDYALVFDTRGPKIVHTITVESADGQSVSHDYYIDIEEQR